MGRSSTSFRKGEGGRPKDCKNKKTLLAEQLGLTADDLDEVGLAIFTKLNQEIDKLPIRDRIKAWCIVFEFFVGKPK